MASESYEFRCPQFCDFTEIDPCLTDGIALGGFSPDLENERTVVNAQAKRFVRKHAHAAVRRTVQAQQTLEDHSYNRSDSEKWLKVKISKRLSKSDDSVYLRSRNLNPSAYDACGFPLQQKQSLSENDLGPKTKKIPTTPMCLKRTLCKTKTKKWKTSEELELEKIAELQRQMQDHLRANEIAMRRMKIKTNPFTIQRERTKTDLRSKDNFQLNAPKDHKVLGRFNGLKHTTTQQNTSPSRPQERIGTKGILPSKVERPKKVVNCFRQIQKTITKGLVENNQDPKFEIDLIKNMQHKHYTAHSGLAFLGNSQKITTFKPFNLKAKDNSVISSCRAEKDISIKDQIKIPRTGRKLDDKENYVYQSSFSEMKPAKRPMWRTPFHVPKSKDI